ncbi:PREDICTED: protein EMBRYONIC FLOWER 1-like [Brassica oleracea var. oleracea]|uniref:protein EMBRYONIC FLOWER 1-like n=1 Tax=Brassica oleracea var. oleracea TaxID=109376 RepID=UPI0006A71334|nr:PREDICTED: protein EMBRYONIC FLOWER 1-like [Brassica oleracea var. oleracea]
MGSSTKVNSIVINLTGANNEIGMVGCDGFSICDLIAEGRETDPKKYWPFPEESASLVDKQSDSLPHWWPPSLGRTRNIDADGTNESGLPSNSTSIISTNGLNGSSSIIPSQSELNSRTAIDQERLRNIDIAGSAVVVNEDINCERSQVDDQRDNAVVENEDVNCERPQNDDQSDNAVVENENVNCERSQQDDQRDNDVAENEDVNCERSQKDDQRDNAAEENEDVNCERSQQNDQTDNNALVVNEDVNCERSQKDDQRATRSSKKVHPPPFRTYALRNKTTKNYAVVEPIGNKRAEKQPNVEQLAVTEIAACAEDTQPEESESRSLFIGGAPSTRTRNVRTRRLAEVNGKRRVQKRKCRPGSTTLSRNISTVGAASGNAFKTGESAHGTESTESEFDKDPIKGKKKNVRFQVEDELDTEPEPEVDDEKDEDFYPWAKRTKKVKIAKKKRATTAINPSNKASSSVQPSLNETETVPSPPRDQGTEERVGTSLDDELASDGYVRKTNAPPVNERQENNRMRSSYVPVFGNPSIPNTGRGLGTGPGAIYFGSGSSNRTNQRNTSPSTQVAAQSTVPRKDASVPNTDRGLGTRSGAIYFGSSNNNNNQRSTPSSTQVAVPQKDASIPNTVRGLGTGPVAVDFGGSSNNNNNQRSTPSSTQVAVPQKDASIPNTGRGLGTRSGAIYFGSNNINNSQRNTPPTTVVATQSSVPQKDASVPNTSRLGSGPRAIYFGSSNSNNNQRDTPPSTVVAAQSSVAQKDASVSDRKGKGVMVQSHDEEVPQKPKTPFLFDLNETYEDVTSLEDNTNAAREEDRVPVRSEQSSVEMFTPRQNSYMASSSVMPPPVQESRRRSSILFPGHSPQWMGNVPMASPYHHPSPSTYQAMRVPPHHYGAPSPPVWASSMIPPQYHHHHFSPPAPFNMDYPSMFAQAPSSEPRNLSYYGANLLNQAMMSRMDPRFRSNTPVDHHGNFGFAPRHVHPVNQFNQIVELQCSHERSVYSRTISNQGRFQQRRNAASFSNASTSYAANSSGSSSCVVSRYPGEISEIEPGNIYLVHEEDLHVPERISEFEQADEEQAGPITESG